LRKEWLGLISPSLQRSRFFHPDLVYAGDVVPGNACCCNPAAANHAKKPFEQKEKEALTI
jgi:hypothetical protein